MTENNPDLAKLMLNLLTMARSAAEARANEPAPTPFDVLIRQAKDDELEDLAGILANQFVTTTKNTLSGWYQAEAS